MHASPIVPLLHRWLQRACPTVHAARATAVVTVVEALVLGAKLALTSLGRNLRSAAFTKHSIKRVDRLLGNQYLHAERTELYRAIAHWLLAATPRPVLLIGWADCGPGHRWLLLRAAVPIGGRAVPVYEEVHPLRRYNSPRTHRLFLTHLRGVPPGSRIAAGLRAAVISFSSSLAGVSAYQNRPTSEPRRNQDSISVARVDV